MQIKYSGMDICFSMDGVSFHASNIIYEHLTRVIPSHSHGSGCYEIHYIADGCGELAAQNRHFSIQPNTLYITGPHVEHGQTPVLSDPMKEYCIYLNLTRPYDQKKISRLMKVFFEYSFWYGEDHYNIHSIMKQLFTELEQKEIGYAHQAQLLLQSLLISIVRNYLHTQRNELELPSSNMSDRNSIVIEEYFLYHYADLSLSGLSKLLSLSTRQTQRLLQSYYGKSFHQKKVQARMSAAVILLQNPRKSIASIASDLGYSSQEYFSNAFHAYYQMSPREYRKQYSLST